MFAIITASAALFPTVSAGGVETVSPGEGNRYFSPPPEAEQCKYTIYRVASKDGYKALVFEKYGVSYINWDVKLEGVDVQFDAQCNPKYESDLYVFKKGYQQEKHIWLSRPSRKSTTLV
ncbi:hypothetical protein PspLS_11826 [Pyricularia sp. CBS 133598]|nr:hypothetical protein PspLS_11826 [Pyricularia sp. CBS 133598]